MIYATFSERVRDLIFLKNIAFKKAFGRILKKNY